MKKFYQTTRILMSLASMLAFVAAGAQQNRDITVLLTAKVSESPASVTLSWPAFSNANYYWVFRKEKEATDWGQVIDTLPGTATSFIDNNVEKGKGYEYRVYKSGGTNNALGYIYAGIGLDVVDKRGTIALVVDNTYANFLAAGINRLEMDMIGDGWQVVRIPVNRTDNINTVKNKIKAVSGIKAVFLLGHVAVPYSGNINPDGHPDHQGAWPADGFYGDINFDWLDIAVNNSGASRPENKNIPGDGKFDHDYFATDVELQVGRVDMINLPAFSDKDSVLLSYYLDKNHRFRHGQLTAPLRALIDDNFQSYSIASSGWRNFAAMVDTNKIVDNTNPAVDYYSTLKNDWYLWSCGAGPGSYNSCGGVINSSQFATDSIKTIFTSLAGSYFGDWDSQNNILRSAIASKPGIIASFWGGIPNWALHHMVMGENIGYSARITQNNPNSFTTPSANIYDGNFNASQNMVHIALMGDPTLRMHVVNPPATVSATGGPAKKVTLSWTAVPDAIGYHIYRAKHLYGAFERITATPTTATAYADFLPYQGHNVYMVRAVRKELTPAGTYYNMSQGVFDSTDVTFTASLQEQLADWQVNLYPNPNNGTFTLQFPEGNYSSAQVEVCNLLGQNIFATTAENSTVSINLGNEANGIYIVKVSRGGLAKSFKMIKQ